jgi:hypothetical protein
MSITTRDLKLRQKEVEKNLNETYSTLRKQPEGGLGAMIQKPNHFEPPIIRVPTLFTPSPMLSSLPYLAEWVKVRSNENAINITAHLIRQREAQKASIIYDDIKQNNIDMRNEEVSATVSRNFSPSTADLLRKYLSNEIDKARDGERKIQEQRMKRLDLQMNPARPEQPAPIPATLRTLTSGDVGRPNVPDQAELRELRNQFYDRKEKEAKDSEDFRRIQETLTAEEAKDQAVKRKFSNLSEGLIARENNGGLDMIRQLRKFKEDQISEKLRGSTAPKLKETIQGFPAIAKAETRPIIPIVNQSTGQTEFRRASGTDIKKKEPAIKTLVEAKAKGLIGKIPFDIAGSPLLTKTTGAGRKAGGGGGVGGAGGGGAEPLYLDIRERMAKGIV